MKINLKINNKRIFSFAYMTLLIINIFTIIMLFQLLKKYVYGSMFVDQNFVESQKIKPGSDLDLNKFDLIIKEIDARQQTGNVITIKNAFD